MVINKDFRKKEVLDIIVEQYIANATPISSRSVADIMGLSSATIRSVMFELEKEGMIRQPHTSAGRIPTNEAYRLHARNIIGSFDASKQDLGWIRNKYFAGQDAYSAEDIVRLSLRVLSELTQETCIALLPDIERGFFKHIKFVVLPDGKILAVLVMMSQFVDTFPLHVDRGAIQHLEQLANLLNGEYQGYSFYEMRSDLQRRAEESGDQLATIYSLAKEIIDHAYLNSARNKFFIEGVRNMFSKPEFFDADRLQYVFEVLEDKNDLISLIAGDMKNERIGVHIGVELPQRKLEEVSILNAFFGTYRKNSVGSIGVFGPTRMPYRQALPLVEYFGQLIDEYI